MSEQVDRAKELLRLHSLGIRLKSESYAMLLLAASLATDEAVEEATRKVAEFQLVIEDTNRAIQEYENLYGAL